MANEMTETEMLARMWIECDPNRLPALADEIITMHNPERKVPRWHWFTARADATQEFLAKHGYKLVKIDGE